MATSKQAGQNRLTPNQFQPVEMWKDRLYDHYVSTGQAAVNTAGGPAAAFAGRAAFINSIIKNHVPKDKLLRITDLGCGHGTWLYFLRCAGYQNVFGIDASAEQVAAAREMGIEGIFQHNLAEYLSEVGEGSTDVVLLVDILEHLTREELFVTLDGVLRMLRPGGRCIIRVPNGDGIFGLGIRYGDFTHEQAFTRMSAEQVLRAIGFSSVECFEERPAVHSPKSLVRRILWVAGTAPVRLLYAAESGSFSAILSRTMLICCTK